MEDSTSNINAAPASEQELTKYYALRVVSGKERKIKVRNESQENDRSRQHRRRRYRTCRAVLCRGAWLDARFRKNARRRLDR